MNSSNRDDFERMVQLAEFGAKRHDERRQVEFRVFIAYITLLVLAFYKVEEIEALNRPDLVILGLLSIHCVYLLWEIRLSIAMQNDESRRNFYLKKAECILDHLWKHPNVPFYPRKNVCVTFRHSDGKDKICEYKLFKMEEPEITLVPPMWKFWKHWGQILNEWSRPFQVVIPTVILLLLILKFAEKSWIVATICINFLFLFIFPLWGILKEKSFRT